MSTPPPGQWGPANQPPLPPQQPPPPGYYPQQPGWGAPPPLPPRQNNTMKWLLAAVGVLLVIAISVGVTVLVTRDGSGGDGPSTATSASGPPIASADDNGPIEIITSEPTCSSWMPARDAMARVLNNGWGDRDPAIPASDWTALQRSQYEATAKSLRDTADQAVDFARRTPHRVVRELYEQFIAFARAYADSVPTYTSVDNYLAQAHLAASYAIESICNSITYGSAALRAVPELSSKPPSEVSSPIDIANPERVVMKPSSTCDRIREMQTKLVADTDRWSKYDPNIPFDEWPVERKSDVDPTKAVLEKFAGELETVGLAGGNATFEDLTSLGALYLRAYSSALSSYQPADTYLFIIGTRANNILVAACDAVTG